jgi:hypothetical protein
VPTLRALPLPRGGENRLLALYRDGLARHWSVGDRALGSLVAALRLDGWSVAERGFISPEIRAAGLSMRARKGVHRLLNPAAFPLGVSPLKNKTLFATHVAAHALPAPETFDAALGSLEAWLARRDAVIAKPSYSSRGRGVALLVCDDPPALARRLRPLLEAGGVVQEKATTHPDLADLSPGALPTLRVVTCLDEAGEPEVCAVVLRLGSGGPRPVDNFNAGGLAVAIDQAGRAATAYRTSGSRVQVLAGHPVTGATISGLAIPDLDAARASAVRAHATLPPGWTVVGWDVGLTDRGPLLIEGNWNPGTDIVQLVDGVGLDATRLGALYRHHLARLPPDEWRRARPVERDRR